MLWLQRGCFVLLLTVAIVSSANAQWGPPWGGGTFQMKAGSGDGSVELRVDRYGSFGDFDYDPIGPLNRRNTSVIDHAVYIRFGLGGGPRQNFGNNGGSITTVTANIACTSTFKNGPLSVKLDQNIAPLLVGPTQNGAILTQVYTITNTGPTTSDFELVFFGHAHPGGTDLGGGRKAGPPETFYLFDHYKSPTTLPLEYNVTGGTIPATNRYEVSRYDTLGNNIQNGAPLTDSVQFDGNADGLVDAASEIGSHVACGIRRTYSIAAGANATYTVVTTFGDGTITVATPGISLIEPTGETNVTEGSAGATYEVVLNTAPTNNVTISLNPGTQLKVVPSTLTFTPSNWSTPQTVTVTAVDDGVTEGLHSGDVIHKASSWDAGYNNKTVNLHATITDKTVGGEGLYNAARGANNLVAVAPALKNEGAFGFGGGQQIARSPVLSSPYVAGDPQMTALPSDFVPSHGCVLGVRNVTRSVSQSDSGYAIWTLTLLSGLALGGVAVALKIGAVAVA